MKHRVVTINIRPIHVMFIYAETELPEQRLQCNSQVVQLPEQRLNHVAAARTVSILLDLLMLQADSKPASMRG